MVGLRYSTRGFRALSAPSFSGIHILFWPIPESSTCPNCGMSEEIFFLIDRLSPNLLHVKSSLPQFVTPILNFNFCVRFMPYYYWRDLRSRASTLRKVQSAYAAHYNHEQTASSIRARIVISPQQEMSRIFVNRSDPMKKQGYVCFGFMARQIQGFHAYALPNFDQANHVVSPHSSSIRRK